MIFQSEFDQENQNSLNKKNRLDRERLCRWGILLFPLLSVCTLFFLRQYGRVIADLFPPCLFRLIFGYYCPGCGNTRSVLVLAQGDILASLRYNITPVLLIMTLVLLYIEGITYAFGHYRRILPRTGRFWWPVLILMLLYFFFRNFIPYLTP